MRPLGPGIGDLWLLNAFVRKEVELRGLGTDRLLKGMENTFKNDNNSMYTLNSLTCS